MLSPEEKLQAACVEWFRYQFPALKRLLFAVPNGGLRSKAVAGKLKATGVVPGVADMILLVSNSEYNSLCIEMKNGNKGVWQDTQQQWAKDAEHYGNKYVLCKTFDEFQAEIIKYISG